MLSTSSAIIEGWIQLIMIGTEPWKMAASKTVTLKYLYYEYILYGAIIVILNLYTYVTVSLVPNFQSTLGTLVKVLTITDVLIGLVVLMDGIGMYAEWNPGLHTCNVMSFILSVSLGTAIILFGCISYDRFHAVVYPNTYATLVTNGCMLAGKCSLSCCVLFLPSLLGLGVSDSGSPQSCIQHWESTSTTSFVFLSMLVVASMLISAICYFHMLDICIKRVNTPKRHQKDIFSVEPSHWDIQTAKVFLGIISLFYMMWLPFMILSYIKLTSDIWRPTVLYSLFLKQGLFTCLLKFVIYVVWIPSFRKALLEPFWLITDNCDHLCTELTASLQAQNFGKMPLYSNHLVETNKCYTKYWLILINKVFMSFCKKNVINVA